MGIEDNVDETAVVAFQPIVPRGPARSQTESAPESCFHGRYKLNEAITDDTTAIFATDVKSVKPCKNLKVLISVYTNSYEYNDHIDMLRKLRSEFVAGLLDHWEENGRHYIVLERGTVRLDETVLLKKKKLSGVEKRAMLGNVAAASLFLLHHGYYCDLQLQDFMDYGNKWKLCGLHGVRVRGKNGPYQHPLHCFGADESIINGSLRLLETVPFSTFNLGMVTLDLLTTHPLLEGKSYEEVCGLAAVDDARLAQLQVTEEEGEVIRAVREILTAPEVVSGGVTKSLIVVADVLRPWAQQDSSRKAPSSAGFLPTAI